jgi:6-phosphogluconolactonase/glucosamine-6-phosphate isomerase/deaminase
MQIHTESDIESLKKQTAAFLTDLFTSSKEKPLLFLTSGGSAFYILEHVIIPNDSRVSIGVLDERYSEDFAVNNFTQLKNTAFFKRSEKLFEHILDTSMGKGESLEDFAERYEALLRTWMVENPQGTIIATVGMGSDGHTSGMMPFPEDKEKFEKLFNDGHRLVVGYDAGDKNKYRERATTTMEFMRNIHYAVSYIVGESKKDAWQRVVLETGSLSETPARILREMEDVSVFTDLG